MFPFLFPLLVAAQTMSPETATAVAGIRRTLDVARPPHNAYFIDGQESKGIPYAGQGKLFAMKLERPKAPDALVACGMALADGVPSLYLVHERDQLPWFLRQADGAYPRLVAILDGDLHQSLTVRAAAALSTLRVEPLPHAALPQDRVDTFIGCMMTGLTDAQYADGQRQLQAINTTLVGMGSSSNWCEGIRVADKAAFETPVKSLRDDLEAVRAADHCVFYAYDQHQRPSGMWVELGAAIAWKKPIKLLVPSTSCMPPGLQEGPLPPNLKVVVYGDHESLLQNLKVLLR